MVQISICWLNHDRDSFGAGYLSLKKIPTKIKGLSINLRRSASKIVDCLYVSDFNWLCGPTKISNSINYTIGIRQNYTHYIHDASVTHRNMKID